MVGSWLHLTVMLQREYQLGIRSWMHYYYDYGIAI